MKCLRFVACALFVAACSSGSSPGRPDAFVPGFDAAPDVSTSDAGTTTCTRDDQCADRIACSIDDCVDGICQHRPCVDCCEAGLACDVSLGCTEAPEPCAADEDCSDTVRCTIDACRDGYCAHEANDGLCAEGQICLPAAGCIPTPPTSCTSPEDCAIEGTRCVGEWSCEVEFGCLFVSAIDCDDADDCTVDSCVDAMGGCVHAPRDDDMDGATPATCGGGDCADDDRSRHPGATDVCGDGIDQDCDGTADDGCCTAGPCTTTCDSGGTFDCATGACVPPAETCNGMDDDCDTVADDGLECVYGSSSSCPTTCGSTGTRACTAACTWDLCVPPAEICNGADDDCDTACDDGFACCRGSARACSTLGFHAGTAICRDDCTGFDTSTCTNCGNGTIDSGEQCDGVALGGATCASVGMGFNAGTLRCAATCAYDTSMCRFDPTGTYSLTPAPTYTCAFGLVGFNLATMSLSLSGSTMTATGSGLPCSPMGTFDSMRRFDLVCTAPGTCAETYRLVGSFTSDTAWTGTFSATYVGGGGACYDCTNRSWSVAGTRS